MASEIDYLSVELPDRPPDADWHYTERRALLLQYILDKGTPEGINQTRFAEQFSVDQSQISKDIDRLGDSIGERLGSNAELRTRAVYDKALNVLLEAADEGDTQAARNAVKTVNDLNGWLAATGRQDREPDRHEIDARVDAEVREAGYHVVEHIDEDTPRVTVEESDQDGESVEFAATPSTTTETDADNES